MTGPRFSSEYNLISSSGHFGPKRTIDHDNEDDDDVKKGGLLHNYGVRGIRAYGVTMPDLAVCSPHPFDPAKIAALNVSYELVSYLTYALSPFNSNAGLFRCILQPIKAPFSFNSETLAFFKYEPS